MSLRHPFDMKDQQRNCQRRMREHSLSDFGRRADNGTLSGEPSFEFLRETFEQLNVFCFFTGKLQESANTIIVVIERRADVIQYERENELLDQAKDREIGVSADLIQNTFFIIIEKCEF